MVVLEAGRWHLLKACWGWRCCLSCNELDTVSYCNTVRTDPGRNWDKTGSPIQSNHTRIICQNMAAYFLHFKVQLQIDSFLNLHRNPQARFD